MCVYLQKGLSVEATLQRVDAKSLQHLQVNGTAGPSKRELRREEKRLLLLLVLLLTPVFTETRSES